MKKREATGLKLPWRGRKGRLNPAFEGAPGRRGRGLERGVWEGRGEEEMSLSMDEEVGLPPEERLGGEGRDVFAYENRWSWNKRTWRDVIKP